MKGKTFSQIILIELFAIFQGVAFGLIPAMMKLVTSASFHNLSTRRFHILFIPLLLASLLLAAIAGGISQKGRLHVVFVGGMIANFIALLLIALTSLTLGHPFVSFSLLFGALFFLGGGISTVMTVLSRWISEIFYRSPFRGNLFLWAGASLGLLLSGGLVEYVLLLHKWWLAPLLIMGALFVLLMLIDLFGEYPEISTEKNGELKLSVLLFLVPGMIYGYLSSSIGIWSLPSENQFFIYWAITTLSRFLIGLSFPLLPPFVWYCFLPVFIVIAPFFLPMEHDFLAFALAALFPINLVWMQERFKGRKSLVTGLGIACFLLGIALGRPLPAPSSLIFALGGILILFHLIAFITFPTQKKKKADQEKPSS